MNQQHHRKNGMKVLAIDSGSTHSAYVVYDTTSGDVIRFNIVENLKMLDCVYESSKYNHCGLMFIEDIECFGMAVGKSVFETCIWIGRFIQQWHLSMNPFHRIKRSEIKLELCNTKRAKDTNIRQSIMDMYGATKKEVIGTTKERGPLYGIKSHCWSALAVAIVGTEKHCKCDLGV